MRMEEKIYMHRRDTAFSISTGTFSLFWKDAYCKLYDERGTGIMGIKVGNGKRCTFSN